MADQADQDDESRMTEHQPVFKNHRRPPVKEVILDTMYIVMGLAIGFSIIGLSYNPAIRARFCGNRLVLGLVCNAPALGVGFIRFVIDRRLISWPIAQEIFNVVWLFSAFVVSVLVTPNFNRVCRF